ncbi:unnamed protein product [Durusdinium trenchii]|uniref:Uncharacterized protein n=1 Tax=Durusdinium trenchii TaxID=1381693 RepID=A0ABP0KET4_9DINO
MLRFLGLLGCCQAGASSLVALQTSFAMNADVAKQEETCEPTSQQKFRDAIGLRTKHLNSESVTFEEKLGAVHLELTGEERASTFGSLSAALDNIEAAMKRRQSDMEHLLKATEAAIARAWAGFVSRWASTMSYVVSTKSGDVLR